MKINGYQNMGVFSQRTQMLQNIKQMKSENQRGGNLYGDRDTVTISLEEQLKDMEQQISQEMTRQNKNQIEKSQSSKRDDEPKTRQEIEQERISDLVDLSSGLSQTKTIRSSQTRIEGEARVLESEIKMDKGRTGDTEMTARKEEKLMQLQQKASELTSKVVEISGEIAEKIKEDHTYIRQELPEGEKAKENETSEDMQRDHGYHP